MHQKTYKNLNEKIPSINFLVLMGNLHYCDSCWGKTVHQADTEQTNRQKKKKKFKCSWKGL